MIFYLEWADDISNGIMLSYDSWSEVRKMISGIDVSGASTRACIRKSTAEQDARCGVEDGIRVIHTLYGEY